MAATARGGGAGVGEATTIMIMRRGGLAMRIGRGRRAAGAIAEGGWLVRVRRRQDGVWKDEDTSRAEEVGGGSQKERRSTGRGRRGGAS